MNDVENSERELKHAYNIAEALARGLREGLSSDLDERIAELEKKIRAAIAKREGLAQ